VELRQRAVQAQAPVGGAGHQRQTGQARRRAVRSARRWLRALASCQPQAGQAATQRPWR